MTQLETDLLELKHRVSALEAKFAHLPNANATGEPTSTIWLDKVFGIFANDPEFEEAVKEGKKWRLTEPPLDDTDTIV